jgi:REP element-mobilizing transposase RayT
MSQSLSQLYVHIIFHVHDNAVGILPEHAHELYAYIGGIINQYQSRPIQIGGMPDHVHVLCSLSKNIPLSRLVEEIKRNSSRWIKSKGSHYSKFAWQGGYAAFSVSASIVERTGNYIQGQAMHHRKRTYEEEVLLFLKEYAVEYDETYLFK